MRPIRTAATAVPPTKISVNPGLRLGWVRQEEIT